MKAPDILSVVFIPCVSKNRTLRYSTTTSLGYNSTFVNDFCRDDRSSVNY